MIKSMTLDEYRELGDKNSVEQKYRKYAWLEKNKLFKKMDDGVWRPITWCDGCEEDLESVFAYDDETEHALCQKCAESTVEQPGFAALGIVYEP